ncbi:MAG: amino acid ABC transporter substrate-binding protein, partial [Gemmatimonadales bacterium]
MPLLLAAALALIVSGCGDEEPPIRIGATMSQTGAYSTQGLAARNGYRLCEADVNAEGGLL